MSLPRMLCSWSIATVFVVANFARAEEKVLPPISERFAGEKVEEVPDFQRHISPLLGRLGCNSRSCHGSFQGQGGFRLSLFGYDFAADHKELLAGKEPRVNLKEIDESLILTKPTDEDNHEGGKRYEKGKWEHHTLRRWIEAGGKYDAKEPHKLVRLEVTPAELWFKSAGEKVTLKAVAVWADGLREDVTPLCRFQSNSEQIASVDATGVVKANEPGDSHVVVFYDNAVVPVPVIRPVSDFAGDKYPKVETPTKIDALVVEKLKKLGVTPSELSADHEYLRRLCLDLTGSLPSAAEVEAFLGDKSPNKRAEKIEELLKSPAYAAWWTTKLCDFTGNNDQQLLNGARANGAQEWYDWIYKRVAANDGYDKIAEGIVLAVSRRPDQSYLEYCEEMSKLYQPGSAEKFADRPSLTHYWNRRNIRTTEERAIGFAYTFLGIRIQCAQCHKHPFDQWSKDDFEQFKGFFAGITVSQANRQSDKEQYEQLLKDLGIDPKARNGNNEKMIGDALKQGKTVPFGEIYTVSAPNPDDKKSNSRVPKSARILGEEKTDLAGMEDVRQPLMDWLRKNDNPYFARAFVNRVWANYFNVGIVQPPDDLSLANPPSNKPLLDYLTTGFVEHKFDMQWLHREICNSRTYQTSWKPNETNGKDERNFSRSVPRRLPAEAAYDACLAATSDDARTAEFRTNLKERAISVPGASARNNNGKSTFALQVFGRSIRESNCDCDRSSEASLLQTVYLQNDQSVLGMVNGGKGTWVDQISREWNKTGTSSDRDLPEGLNVKKEIARTENRLAQLKKEKEKKPDNKAIEEQVERLENRLAALELASGKASEEPAKKPEATKPTEDQTAVIRQAYLRTLSRPPTEDETARCRDFLASANTPLDGVRGLLWALINTKEFIVNH